MQKRFLSFLEQSTEAAVLVLLIFSVLWKGGKGLETTWLLALLAGTVTILFWYQRKWKEKEPLKAISPYIWGTAMLFLVWSILSLWFSTASNYGLDEILEDVSCLLLSFWMLRRFHIKGKGKLSLLDRFLTTLSIVAVIACVVGVFVYALQPVNRFVGTFFDPRYQTDYWPNAWAEFVLLTWPAVVWSVRGRNWPVKILAAGFLIGCLFLSYSRGAFIALLLQVFLGAVLLLIHWYRSGRLRSAVSKTLLTSVVIAVAAVIVFQGVNLFRGQFHEVESIGKKATFTAEEGTISIDEREAFWKESFILSLQRPVFGWGPYSFRFAQPRLQTSVFATSDHPHNVFLKLALERGWPATILFALFLMVVLLAGIRSFFVMPDWRDERLVAILAIVGVYAHNLIDYNLQFIGIALPLFLFIGFLASSAYCEGKRAVPTRLARGVEVMLAVVLLIVTILEGRMLVLSSLGRRAEAHNKIDEAIAWYEQAKGEWFSRDLHLSRTHVYQLQQKPFEAINALLDYFRHNKEDARAYILQGDLQMQQQHVGEALFSYDQAVTLGKYNYLAATSGLVDALEALNDQDVLNRRKADIDTIVDAFASAIEHNTHFIAQSHNPEDLADLTHKLAKLYPTDAAHYRTIEVRVKAAAEKARSAVLARPAGYLW